ncbi:MAG: hypothetical protein P8100_02490 [bacterium]
MFFNTRSIRLFLAVTFLLSAVSCSETYTRFPQADIAPEEKVQVRIHRFDQALFGLEPDQFQEGLLSIQDEFKPLLAADLSDTANVMQLYRFVTDTQVIRIYEQTEKVYPASRFMESSLSDAFTRFHYLFPTYPLPEVYTYISDLYFEMPIIIQGDQLIVGIDLYLGSDFPLYRKLGLPFYKIRWMEPESLPVDVMKALFHHHLAPEYSQKTLLDRMIDGGKLLVYLDAVFPSVADEFKISYTPEQLYWANENEQHIWAFLVSNQMLYTTDYQTITKLIQDGPFTTGFSNESPARLGIFIGWKIVLSYLNNNPGVSLEELFRNVDSQDILQNSGYKP